MFLCLLIQPRNRSEKPSPSPDVVIYAAYACLAAGHMAFQSTRFDPDAIAQLNGFLSEHFMPTTRRRMLGGFPPALQKMVATLNASFQVGVIFLGAVTFVLFALLIEGRLGNPEIRPRRQRPLLWALLLLWFWVVEIFGGLTYIRGGVLNGYQFEMLE
ncbi:hypothetical protein OQA88_10264 [Cercophora sp. LCS_1]